MINHLSFAFCENSEQVLDQFARYCQKTVLGDLFFYLFIQQAVQCFHISLRPFNNYITFFVQFLLSFQSSSIDPFSPISPLIPSAQVSLGLPHFLLPG